MKGTGNMEFPEIQTNFWDGIIAVPSIMILTQMIKIFPIPKKYIPTVATVIGYLFSIFISHPKDLWAGLFMGGFYGAAAIGLYSSLKTAWITFRKKYLKRVET